MNIIESEIIVMGYFAAIDGLDGSGKATQSRLLGDALRKEGKNVRAISFPAYDSKSSTFVKMYLSGELGENPADTGSYAASSFFSIDRYISYRTDWKRDYNSQDTIILADRYTSANAVHQLSKLEHSEWDGFLSWLIDFEYCKLGLPIPDTVIYLELTPELSSQLIESRSKETGRDMDIHELDREYLKKSYEAAIYASERLGWTKIRCFEGNRIRAIEEISAEILQTVHEQMKKGHIDRI